MKVKLLVSRAGVGFVQNAGDEIDVDDEQAQRMIEAQQAVPVGKAPAKQRRKATAEPDESR